MADFIAAVDQGTTSTRCIIFDHDGNEVARSQREHRQLLPHPGWVEHDPVEIWSATYSVIEEAMHRSKLGAHDVAALGLTNQRETVVAWNRKTGVPYAPAIVWQDTRTADVVRELAASDRADSINRSTGLRPSTYFSAPKMRWLWEHLPELRADALRGEAAIGTVDSWLLWKLTGGENGGVHRTDPTNASRTMLMNIESRQWDDDLLAFFGIPADVLPQIAPSVTATGFGRTRPDGPLRGEVPITGVLGDQQAAMMGQVCFELGSVKSTYGTGSFLLQNTGDEPVFSRNGLLTTLCYAVEEGPTHYALEGSIAVTGAAVQWLRDQLGLIGTAAEIETLADQVTDAEGLYLVPAFSGLFAPYWRSDARGLLTGLTRYHTRAHLARAVLDAICHQTADVVDAMCADTAAVLPELHVDGGVTANNHCMQIQADLLGIPVVRPKILDTTALGAAYAAGLAVGYWSSFDELRENWQEDRRWVPSLPPERRATLRAEWRDAVARTLYSPGRD